MESKTPDTPRLRIDGAALSGRFRSQSVPRPHRPPVVSPGPMNREGLRRVPTPLPILSSQAQLQALPQPQSVPPIVSAPVQLPAPIEPTWPSVTQLQPVPPSSPSFMQGLASRLAFAKTTLQSKAPSKRVSIGALALVVVVAAATTGILTLTHTKKQVLAQVQTSTQTQIQVQTPTQNSALIQQPKIIPAAISNAVRFGILLPIDKLHFVIDTTSFGYDDKTGVLSFAGMSNGTTKVNFNEQALPASFKTTPALYDKLIGSLFPYKTLASPNGAVSLTRPKQLQGAESAVLKTSSVLLFARPSKDLPDATWQQIFNSLQAPN